MIPAKIDLAIYQGATFEKTVYWKAGEPAVAVDLTGHTARMQIRHTLGDDEILCLLTTENGKITLTALEGKIFMTISAPETTTLTETTFKSAVYDLELVSAMGKVTRFMEGSVFIYPEVTR